MSESYAYAGQILRVDLSAGETWADPFSPEDRRKYVGGVGLGAKILWEEVPPEVAWDHPGNRLVMATGNPILCPGHPSPCI